MKLKHKWTSYLNLWNTLARKKLTIILSLDFVSSNFLSVRLARFSVMQLLSGVLECLVFVCLFVCLSLLYSGKCSVTKVIIESCTTSYKVKLLQGFAESLQHCV